MLKPDVIALKTKGKGSQNPYCMGHARIACSFYQKRIVTQTSFESAEYIRFAFQVSELLTNL